MKRRDVIKMTDAEIDALLDERHTMSAASIGPTGRIQRHLISWDSPGTGGKRGTGAGRSRRRPPETDSVERSRRSPTGAGNIATIRSRSKR